MVITFTRAQTEHEHPPRRLAPMSYFSRRGVAALVVASALVFAPLASVTAYADEAPFVEAPIAETPIATEPTFEEPVIEEPAVEVPIADSPVVAEQTPAEEAPADEAPAVEVPAEDAPADDTSSERERSLLVAPTPLALAPQCDVTPGRHGLPDKQFRVAAGSAGFEGARNGL